MADQRDGFRLVDGDGHVYEPEDLWTKRMDASKWGDWIPRREVIDGVYDTTWLGGQVRAGGKELVDSVCAKVGMTPRQFFDLTEQLRVPGGFDPRARLADMDRDGIEAAVLYPSQALFFGPADGNPALQNVDFVADCQRAYNQWLAEYCAEDPKRLFGAAIVPLQDPQLAVREAEYAVNELGMRALAVRPSAYVDELPLNHSVYDPFWACAQDLDVPVAFHPGVHNDTPGACRKFRLVIDSPNIMLTNMAQDEIHGGSGLGQAIGNAVDMIVTFGRLLMGGVCERFPRVRFVALESGGGWMPTLLERMDEQVKAFPLERRWLSLLPSEYFRRQCYVSFECEEWNLADSARFLGTDRVIWATDYPHPEYHPGVIKELFESVESLDAEGRRRVLSQNAIDVYRLPI